MTRRDEMLAVITERDHEIARAIVLGSRWYRPLLAWHHRREARRLLALNARDLRNLPPQRHHQPRRIDSIALQPKIMTRRNRAR